MYRLLFGLSIISLTLSHPIISTLTFVGVFLYQNLTEQDKQEFMSIYSNGKDFIKYLSHKAKELKISLKELRKQIITDLEIPESLCEPKDCMKGEAPSDFFDNIPSFSEYLSAEELEKFSTNVPLIEKVAAVIKESLYQPELVWHGDNLTLNDFFNLSPEFDEDEHTQATKDLFKKEFGITLDYTKPMTHSYFRQIKSKLKAVGKNNLNEITNDFLHEFAQDYLDDMDYFFTHGTHKPSFLDS